MEYVWPGIILFIFVLAVFDLSVGVSNDASNFLNSAVGSRAASFKTIVVIAALGVFLGAVMSNGMMDIARHGIFRPERFSFFDLTCIFMAVMVTDIILLDVFNSLGMPTSTTVSLIFDLLGATFAVSLFKLGADTTGQLDFGDLINTAKALQVIIGIFLSVAIAFVFGAIVQWLSRLWLTFNYRRTMRWSAGLFGGVSITAIIYFLLLKGIKGMSFMTPEVTAWIDVHTWIILLGSFIFFTLLMQLLHAVGVNTLKVIVMTGTFSLAMAFAGNDLVNFIGVPLASLESYKDFAANGGGDVNGYMMWTLNGSASTPIWFLIGAGAVMVVALATSKKARKVVETSVNLSRQDAGDELFGSSRLARRLVRLSLQCSAWIVDKTPTSVKRWIAKRMDHDEITLEHGAAFDLVRGSINLVLAGLLIAVGTSMKLPLSTTYVTFMVAMGTSLADRAWGRESAVFRITGVISVIGGWFLTAVIAFIGAAIVGTLLHLGGIPVIIISAIVAIAILLWNNFRHKKNEAEEDDTLFRTILATEDPAKRWTLLRTMIGENELRFLDFAVQMQAQAVEGFMTDNTGELSKTVKALAEYKTILKGNRRKATLCFRRVATETAIEQNTWFHLLNTAQMSMLYNLRRVAEVSYEHVDNNFPQLPERVVKSGKPICEAVNQALQRARGIITDPDPVEAFTLRDFCVEIRERISIECRDTYTLIGSVDTGSLSVLYVYVNLMQEQQELLSTLRKLIRATIKLSQAHPEPTLRHSSQLPALQG